MTFYSGGESYEREHGMVSRACVRGSHGGLSVETKERRMVKLMVALLFVAATVQLVGCASLVDGKNQPISVETRNQLGNVAGANCERRNDSSKWFVTTPGSVAVQKSYQNLTVRCTKVDMILG
jgi:hypothetical protein